MLHLAKFHRSQFRLCRRLLTTKNEFWIENPEHGQSLDPESFLKHRPHQNFSYKFSDEILENYYLQDGLSLESRLEISDLLKAKTNVRNFLNVKNSENFKLEKLAKLFELAETEPNFQNLAEEFKKDPKKWSPTVKIPSYKTSPDFDKIQVQLKHELDYFTAIPTPIRYNFTQLYNFEPFKNFKFLKILAEEEANPFSKIPLSQGKDVQLISALKTEILALVKATFNKNLETYENKLDQDDYFLQNVAISVGNVHQKRENLETFKSLVRV